nr:synaptosomal-associated protein 47 [Manis javanica]XP_036873122.1 synaptosomal-associated protein 47 [Manis javanica]
MNRDVCIHAWPCSYYLESEKQWVPGKLSLMPLSLKFTADKTGETLVSFPLSSVTEIKKEASHFIFSSITVLEKDCLKHWFSALQPSRNAAFSTIEHFWRALLLSGPPAEAASPPMTEGRKLTSLMACSQKRLEDTSRVLHHQGEQLDGIARGLDRMESDLDTTDRLLTELESPWWPFSSKSWKMPSETKPRGGTSVVSSKDFGKEGIVINIPALISQGTESHVKSGRFTILVSGLEIHNADSLLVHRFEREDVDDIKVLTPYEISIRQRFIGKPDIAYQLISAKMPEVIPILEVQFSKKIEFLDSTLMPRSTGTSSAAEKGYSLWHAASELMDHAGCCEPSSGSPDSRLPSVQSSMPFISEGDTQELGQMLLAIRDLLCCWDGSGTPALRQHRSLWLAMLCSCGRQTGLQWSRTCWGESTCHLNLSAAPLSEPHTILSSVLLPLGSLVPYWDLCTHPLTEEGQRGAGVASRGL